MVEKLIETLKTDKYFKMIPLAGVVFLIVGAFSKNHKITIFGVLTFLYGLWAWMWGEVFHIQGNVNLKKLNPIHFVYGYMIFCTISFFIYILISIRIFY